jgi:hypothetical protein
VLALFAQNRNRTSTWISHLQRPNLQRILRRHRMIHGNIARLGHSLRFFALEYDQRLIVVTTSALKRFQSF